MIKAATKETDRSSTGGAQPPRPRFSWPPGAHLRGLRLHGAGAAGLRGSAPAAPEARDARSRSGGIRPAAVPAFGSLDFLFFLGSP